MPGEKKYARYIIDKTPEPPSYPRPADPKAHGGSNVIYINNGLDGAMPNATFLEATLITKPLHPGPFRQHAHSFDEYVTFIGTNIEKPFDLDGVAEFWIEDEKYILTKSCTIFVPKGVFHCPFVFHEVNSPIVFIASAAATHCTEPRDPIDPAPAAYGVL
jgi:mannose-6-phosphate isomerase-like protein (cupin superfamily)